MNKQTSDYISLKGISDRFREVAASISNDEIRSIIRSELKEQVRDQVSFGSVISDIVEEWLDEPDNVDFITNQLKNSIVEKFANKRH